MYPEDVDDTLKEYFALKKAGREAEANELFAAKIPVPYAMAASARAIFGKDIYRDMGFTVQEPASGDDEYFERIGLK